MTKINRDTGCWPWTGSLNKKGYARGSYNGIKYENLHRLFYKELVNSNLPDDIELHHTCKNKQCVNPNHLKEITKKEHRRLYHQKISPEIYKQIVDLYVHGFSAIEISIMLDLGVASIYRRLPVSILRY